MPKPLKFKVRIVPVEGSSREETVEIAPSGASMEEVAKTAGLDPKNLDFTINGRPASLETHVTPDDVLEAKDRGKPAVTASERPRGS
jgi:hypothetical protein